MEENSGITNAQVYKHIYIIEEKNILYAWFIQGVIKLMQKFMQTTSFHDFNFISGGYFVLYKVLR